MSMSSGVLRLRWHAWRYRSRESLFRLPALVVAVGIAGAIALVTLDRVLGTDRWDVPEAFRIQPGPAQELLAVLAGAMITTAGVVFSLTVVSLQLASQQFSPRVMRTFVRDRHAQLVIGLLVSTFAYCVLVLWALRSDDSTAPVMATTAAVLLAVVTVVAIIAHLDHLARGLQVGEVLRAVSGESAEVLAELARDTRHERAHPPVDVSTLGEAHHVLAPRDGWVTQSSLGDLFRAVPEEGVLRLETRVGAYISEGQVLARVWPRPADGRHADALVAEAVLISNARTMQEDFDFGIRQLVDIGLRALSPAINDPTTAIEVVLRVGSSIRRLLAAEDPPVTTAGPGGRVLIRPWDLTYDDQVEHAFAQLRIHGCSEPKVAAALVRTLQMLIDYAESRGRPERVPVLADQLELVRAQVQQNKHWLAEDHQRLRAITEAERDPADHG